MLDKKDMTLLRGMFREVLEENNHSLKREIRDEMHSVVNAAVFASEERMMKRMDEGMESMEGRLTQKIEHVEENLRQVEINLRHEIDGTNTILLSFIEEVEPKIEKHEKKIVRIQRHVKLGSKVKA